MRQHLAVQLHPVGPVDALQNGAQSGELIGHGPAHQGQLLEVRRPQTDARVKPHGTDVEGQVPIAIDQVQALLGRIQQGFQVMEPARVRPEHPDKVVAGTGGVMGHRRVRGACRAHDAFVERTVPAAGIDPQGFSQLRRRRTSSRPWPAYWVTRIS